MSNTITFNPYLQFQGLFIPTFLLRRRELTSDAKILYAYIAVMIGEEKELYLDLDIIASELGISAHILKAAYDELEHYKLVETIVHDTSKTVCRFLYADMLYGSQKVARASHKISKTLSDIDDIESFLNSGFERLYSTYRLKNKEYCGNRRDAYKAFLQLGDTFDIEVLLEAANRYLDDPDNNIKYGLFSFINDRIFLNYLPSNFIYTTDEGEEIFGLYDSNTHLLVKESGEIIGKLTPERMIELLQTGRLRIKTD